MLDEFACIAIRTSVALRLTLLKTQDVLAVACTFSNMDSYLRPSRGCRPPLYSTSEMAASVQRTHSLKHGREEAA